MQIKNEKLIIELARKLTIYQPEISVLKEELLSQYILPVIAIDSCLKNKLYEKKLLLPELRKDGNETIAVASDYGGESSNSSYNTYCFLVFGWNHSFAFFDYMKEIRNKYNLKKKEISFKDIRYGPIKRCLSDYLLALNRSVAGILVTVVIDKKITSVFGDKTPKYVFEEIKAAGFGEWKPKVTEKVMRIVHSVAYLVALLSKDGHKIYWMTDHDSTVPNDTKRDDFFSLFQNVLTLYTNNNLVVRCAVPFVERSIRQLDFLSCSDLVAGTVDHFFTRHKKENNPVFKDEVAKILEWLGRDGIALKKHTVLIKKGENDILEIREVEFKSDKSDGNVHLLPIPVKYKI